MNLKPNLLAIASVLTFSIVPNTAFSTVSSYTNTYGGFPYIIAQDYQTGGLTSSGEISFYNVDQLNPYIIENGSGHASVNRGLIELSSYASGGTVDPTDNTFNGSSGANVYNEGSWTDSITITPSDSSLVGKSGVLYASLQQGPARDSIILSVTGGNEAYYQDSRAYNYVYTPGTNTFIESVQTLHSPGPSGTPDKSILDNIPFVLPIIFGESTPITYRMTSYVDAGAVNGGYGSANADYWLWWGGISSVTDDSGNQVNFTLISESGVNYLSSLPTTVPAPSSVWLFGSALAGLVGFNRRKAAFRLPKELLNAGQS